MQKYLGLDISKDFFDACLFDGQTDYKRFDNTPLGYQELSTWLRKHKVTKKLIVCMEATGNYYENVADYLAQIYSVNVANPLKVKRYSQSLFQRNKNDKADALVIAQYAQSAHLNNKLKYRTPPTSIQYKITRTLALLNQLTEQRTAQINQYKAAKEDFIQSILQTQITATNNAIKATKIAIGQLKNQDKTIKNQTTKLESITGIGKTTALILLMHLTGKAFKNQRQFIAWLGLSPRTEQSGTSKNTQGSLTQYGNRKGKSSLFMPALSVYKRNEFPQLITNMKKRGKKPMVIITAIMRKLAVIAYTLYKLGEYFDKSRYLAEAVR